MSSHHLDGALDASRSTTSPTRRRMWWRLLVVLAVFALIAVACGDSDSGDSADEAEASDTTGEAAGADDGEDAETTEEGDDTDSTEAGGSEDSDGAREEAETDTITVGVASLQEQFPDPHLAVGGLLFPLRFAIADGLYSQALDATWQPALATGSEVSDDGLTWTFTLREGVINHDGSEFTAQDVKTAVDRVLGSEDFAHFAQFRRFATGANVIDDYTVEITTNQPFATLVEDMPAPIPTDYYNEVGEDGFRSHPMAAGPFKFVSQELNASVTYERHDDYWDTENRPNFQNLVFEIIPDESSRVAGIQTGALDVAAGLSPLAAQPLEGEPEVSVLETPATAQGDVYVIDLRYADEDSPLLDFDVRQALLMAVDREAIAESLYLGYASVPSVGISPITLGYDASREPYPYDPDQARQLLEDAGVSDLSVTLNSYSATASLADVNKLVEAVAGYWEQIGVNVELRITDANSYLPEYRANNLRGLGVLSSPSQYFTDPSRYNVFYTTDGAYSMLARSEIDEMFATMTGTVDPAERAAMGEELGDMLYEELWSLPMVLVSTLHAVGPDVEEWSLMDGNPYAFPMQTLIAR